MRKSTRSEKFKNFKLYQPPNLKTIIAPYVKKEKISRKVTTQTIASQLVEEQYKPIFLNYLSTFLTDSPEITALLYESATVLQKTITAETSTIYFIDFFNNQIYESSQDEKFMLKGNATKTRGQKMDIEIGTTVQAYVALKREHVVLDSFLGDKRFPKGVGGPSEEDKSVLCVPIVTPEDNLLVILLFTKPPMEPFSKDDLKISIVIAGWMGAAIHQNFQRLAMCKQQEVNDYLLFLIKLYFEETIDIQKLITEIVRYAKDMIGAQRGNFFVFDKDADEPVADLYEEGIESADPELYKRKLSVKLMSRERGIVSLVIRTSLTVRISDVASDPRFAKEAEMMARNGFPVQSVLCAPIMGVSSILGILQLFNKRDGTIFTRQDENLIKTFAFYSSCALQQHVLAKRLQKQEKFGDVYLGLLDRQIPACRHDADHFSKNLNIRLPKLFFEFKWYIADHMKNEMPQLAFFMIKDMCAEDDLHLENLVKFTLAVRKLYRNNPYHNFEHGFNVAHCMFCILRRNRELFESIEIKALLVACLCHDIDHGGYNNNFLVITNDVISQLYEESPWENYHFFVTANLLRQFQIFKHTTEAQDERFIKEVKDAILATDLQIYLQNRLKLMGIMNMKNFLFDDESHRALLKTIMMTACDLSGQAKPFGVARKITENVYKEFYNQGDREKQLGFVPLAMMDRDREQMIPEDQIEFIAVIVVPVMELLKKLLPNTADLLTECLNLKKTWQDIVQLKESNSIAQEEVFMSHKKK